MATGREIDFESDYRQTEELSKEPLKDSDPAAIERRVADLLTAANMILPDQPTLIKRAVSGLLAGHLILAGPPGTGKTTLARLLAEAFNCSAHLETATADWGTYDVIGGLQPKISQQGAIATETIAPWHGHVVKNAIQCARTMRKNEDNPSGHPRQAHWLIIDEFNRAEIDSAIGGLYTVLGGGNEPLKLWYEQDEQRNQVWMPGRFRIIGTLNSVDTNYVYSFSQGLTRRFRYVYVGVPSKDQIEQEMNFASTQAKEWAHNAYGVDGSKIDAATGTAAPILSSFIVSIRYGKDSVSGWPVGTAQVVDVLKQVSLNAENGDATENLDLAIADLIVPQMMDLRAEQIELVERSIPSSLPRTQNALKVLREAQNTSFA